MDSTNVARTLDLNLLRVFDAMLRHGTVTRAGASLGLSQPAMSYLLGRLRTALGDPLFEPVGRRMQPTPRAEEMAQAVGTVLELVRSQIEAGPHFDPATSERTFRVAMTDVGGYVMLPRLLPRLRELAPSARFVSTELSATDLERALGGGDVDVAIGSFPDLPGSVLQQRLYERDFVVLHGPAHPRLPPKLSLARYLELDHVAVRSPVRTQGAVDLALRRLGRARRTVITVPHWLVVPAILARTAVVATAPRELESAFRAQVELRAVAVPFKVTATTIRQYWHSRYRHEPAGRWLRGVIREVLGE